MRVAVIGVGRMGSQIGWEYARGGHEVTFVARSVTRARATLQALGDASPAIVTSIDEAPPADLVIESVPESFDLKVELLGAAAAAHPGAILASNTSSLPITALGEAIGAPERTIGTHYWNPPLLMPLVEVIRGAASEEVIGVVLETLRALGKRPVEIARDVPGFAWNRLQFALLREALWLVDEGVAEPAVIDEIVRDGLARRWRYTGPFETAALGGLDTFSAVAEYLFPELSTATDAPGLAAAASSVPLAGVAERRDTGLAKELDA
jgi:3-hydroxybutyryl-CoA dehydrogenase